MTFGEPELRRNPSTTGVLMAGGVRDEGCLAEVCGVG